MENMKDWGKNKWIGGISMRDGVGLSQGSEWSIKESFSHSVCGGLPWPLPQRGSEHTGCPGHSGHSCCTRLLTLLCFRTLSGEVGKIKCLPYKMIIRIK